MILKLVCIFAGGGTGCVLRYLAGGAIKRFAISTLPVGTMAVNIAGCFLIGLLASLFAGQLAIREQYRLAIIVGLLGGFTTFSSFALESLELANGGKFALAAVNIIVSNTAGLLAVWLGAKLAASL